MFFFFVALQGVGGVVQFPKGYLQRVYELIRSNGGLCIADEVQTGFGRTGQHFWNFQSHGVTPDIVTMAKGIGNGFPMAAVVTTPTIARSLNKAFHFNTFGGNPISCAVGIAVLKVDMSNEMLHVFSAYYPTIVYQHNIIINFIMYIFLYDQFNCCYFAKE